LFLSYLIALFLFRLHGKNSIGFYAAKFLAER